MTKKKKPSKRIPAQSSPIQLLRRTSLWLLTAGVVMFQASSCGFLPSPQSLPSLPTFDRPSVTATSFKDCSQFFAGGVAPMVPSAPKLRELCYDDFAVLHSGNTRTRCLWPSG